MNALAKRLQVWHAAIVLVWLVLPQFFTALMVWPLYLLVPLAGYALTVCCVGPLRRSVNWLHLGRASWEVCFVTLCTVLVASAALVGWYFLFEPDLSDMTNVLREIPLPSLVPLGIALSI